MIRAGVHFSRAAATVARTAVFRQTSCAAGVLLSSASPSSPTPFRQLHDRINVNNINPVALDMMNYAVSHAKSLRSDESYAQGLLVLEQCLSTQLNQTEDNTAQNSRAVVLLSMANLLYERGNLDEAIEKLRGVGDLTLSSVEFRVAAIEALVGLHLELGQDDASSVLADKCLELVEESKPENGGEGSVATVTRAKALKGLVELVKGDAESAKIFFPKLQNEKGWEGSVDLSYGEYLHAKQNFSLAKELYQKVIQSMPEGVYGSQQHQYAACNMTLGEAQLAATCALGQLEAHLGNFADAEELLTKALTKSEEYFGSHHPKVGVILTCIALMFRRKATLEHSSSLLIQEGLYRKALELLKAPSFETEEAAVDRRDIVALARGGYGEVLCVQQNRRGEGEKMRSWAEATWRNSGLSLAEALDVSETSSKVLVIDARISRTL